MMSSKYHTIRDELLAGHPGTGAYNADDALAADQLNVVNRTRTRDELSASEIFEAIEIAEYKALASNEKGAVDKVLGLGDSIQIGPSSKARAFLLDAFDAGSTTRANLVSLVVEDISRADEIGVGFVKPSHVTYARTL